MPLSASLLEAKEPTDAVGEYRSMKRRVGTDVAIAAFPRRVLPLPNRPSPGGVARCPHSAQGCPKASHGHERPGLDGTSPSPCQLRTRFEHRIALHVAPKSPIIIPALPMLPPASRRSPLGDPSGDNQVRSSQDPIAVGAADVRDECPSDLLPALPCRCIAQPNLRREASIR